MKINKRKQNYDSDDLRQIIEHISSKFDDTDSRRNGGTKICWPGWEKPGPPPAMCIVQLNKIAGFLTVVFVTESDEYVVLYPNT